MYELTCSNRYSKVVQRFERDKFGDMIAYAKMMCKNFEGMTYSYREL